MTDSTAQRIGDYEIIRELGHGGMGKVYLARNVLSDRVEALKILLPDLAGRSEFVSRFTREIKLLAGLDHPNIAKLCGAFSAGDQFVMVMEYVDGVTLAELLEKGALPTKDALNYTSQALSALSYAHSKHVIHRDIKPGNMMLTRDGVVKLMDFGLARSVDDVGMTITGTTLGSLDYASPEQVQSHPTDERSDLYSVGVSLYQMVTGKRMFNANSSYSIMQAQINETPRPPIEIVPGIPQALNEIILMAVAKDPAQRFQSADAFRNALSSVATQTATQSTSANAVTAAGAAATAPVAPRRAGDPGFVPTPTESHTGRNGLIVAAVLILAALVVGGMIYKSRQPKDVDAAGATAIAPGANATSGAPATASSANVSSPPPTALPQPTTTPETNPQQQTTPPPEPPATVARGGKAHNDVPPVPSGPSPQEIAAQQQAELEHKKMLDAMETEIDQMDARAATVESSLDALEGQMHQQGVGLRGDMVAARANMRTDIAKAKQAMDAGDTERTRKFLDMAHRELEKLESFMGRR